MRYSFDTSAWIGAWRRRLPHDVVPSFWTSLDGLIRDGDVRSISEVKAELEKRDDDVLKWVKARADLFIPLSPPVIAAARAILSRFPQLTKPQTDRSAADPFVIALAQVERAAVVTEETRTTKAGREQIPNVCDALGVQCLDVYGFVREQRWSF